MRIYNEVVTIFNDITGQWDTISEDSFEYNGPMVMAQGGMPPNASSINTSDTIADTRKITAGYFTGGGGQLLAADIHSGSLTDTNEKYYIRVKANLETDRLWFPFNHLFFFLPFNDFDFGWYSNCQSKGCKMDARDYKGFDFG